MHRHFLQFAKNDILKLKGFNALKYRSIKELISGIGGTKNIPPRTTLSCVNDNDIEGFTQLIHKCLNSNKKINKADIAHNQTTN